MRENSLIRTGVYAVINDPRGMLLVKKSKGPYVDHLDLPGGDIEFGETPEKALAREILEETTHHLDRCSLWEIRTFTQEWQPEPDLREKLHINAIVYGAEVLNPETNQLESHSEDTSSWKWYQLSELSQHMLTPLAKWAVAKAFRGSRR